MKYCGEEFIKQHTKRVNLKGKIDKFNHITIKNFKKSSKENEKTVYKLGEKSFIQQILLSTYNVPGTVNGPLDKISKQIKTKQNPCP